MRNESYCWSEFYKQVKRRKEKMEIIPVLKDNNGTAIMVIIEKAAILNFYYAYKF
jgi:hypothetical protein